MFTWIYNITVELMPLMKPYIFPFFGIGLILWVIHLLLYLAGGKEHV